MPHCRNDTHNGAEECSRDDALLLLGRAFTGIIGQVVAGKTLAGRELELAVSFRCAGTTMGANAPKAHDLLNSLADDRRTPSIIRLELKHGQYEQIDHVHRKFDPPVTQGGEVSEQRNPVTKT